MAHKINNDKDDIYTEKSSEVCKQSIAKTKMKTTFSMEGW